MKAIEIGAAEVLRWESFARDYVKLRNVLATLPNRTSHDVMVCMS